LEHPVDERVGVGVGTPVSQGEEIIRNVSWFATFVYARV
jgi:hypothetical protein